MGGGHGVGGRVVGLAGPTRIARIPWGSERLAGYAFIAPAAAIIVGLVGYPFALALWFSVSDAWVGEFGRFVGLANYRRLLQNSIFRQTLQNSIVFTASSVALKTVLGLALALLLYRIHGFRRLIRGAVLMPFVIPTALSTLGWWWLFQPTYGVLNWTLKRLGMITTDIPWLADPYLAMLSVVIVNTWRGLPFYAMTILAGLMAIPREYYEAAEADGAGAWYRFRHITLPLIKPVLGIVVLFSTILTLADFNIVFVLTKGGPMNMTHLFSTLSFQLGTAGGKISDGAAVSLFLFPVLVAVVTLQLRIIRRQTAYE
ncbi:MAG: sugar ABC transporter permease [Candidatus Rokubacteria bacterium]|nr:sugar ABC transporter permease [Candidatus Rokubacteria bacterium]